MWGGWYSSGGMRRCSGQSRDLSEDVARSRETDSSDWVWMSQKRTEIPVEPLGSKTKPKLLSLPVRPLPPVGSIISPLWWREAAHESGGVVLSGGQIRPLIKTGLRRSNLPLPLFSCCQLQYEKKKYYNTVHKNIHKNLHAIISWTLHCHCLMRQHTGLTGEMDNPPVYRQLNEWKWLMRPGIQVSRRKHEVWETDPPCWSALEPEGFWPHMTVIKRRGGVYFLSQHHLL